MVGRGKEIRRRKEMRKRRMLEGGREIGREKERKRATLWSISVGFNTFSFHIALHYYEGFVNAYCSKNWKLLL